MNGERKPFTVDIPCAMVRAGKRCGATSFHMVIMQTHQRRAPVHVPLCEACYKVRAFPGVQFELASGESYG